MGKGWTNEDMGQFNTLFDKVREDCQKNASYGKNSIAKECLRLKEQIKKASKQYQEILKLGMKFSATAKMIHVCLQQNNKRR